MLDFIKRLCIAVVLAMFICVLFLGANPISAQTKDVKDYEKEGLIWPTVGEISDTYGTRGGEHYGIDVAAPEGTPVVSIEDGVVSRSYYSDTYGNVVFIKHDNGLESVYAHLHKRNVEEGEIVREGDKVGTVGNTGRSSGNHLHFEIHDGDWNIDKSDSIDPLLVLSSEPEFMFAALGEDSPYGLDWKEREVMSVSATHFVSEEPEIDAKTVIVKAGDTLWDIATENRVTIEQVKEWNHLESDVISIDDKLIVYPAGKDVHIVKQGETLIGIAEKYETSVDRMISQNNLSSDLIVPGQLLSVK